MISSLMLILDENRSRLHFSLKFKVRPAPNCFIIRPRIAGKSVSLCLDTGFMFPEEAPSNRLIHPYQDRCPKLNINSVHANACLLLRRIPGPQTGIVTAKAALFGLLAELIFRPLQLVAEEQGFQNKSALPWWNKVDKCERYSGRRQIKIRFPAKYMDGEDGFVSGSVLPEYHQMAHV